MLIKKYSDVRQIEDLLAIGMKTMKFKILGHRRKAKSSGLDGALQVDDMQLRSEQPDAAELLERRQLADRLAEAVNKLGDRCRELYRLKLAGKSYEEIRDLMGAKTTGAVYTWDFRCREQLKPLLGGKP